MNAKIASLLLTLVAAIGCQSAAAAAAGSALSSPALRSCSTPVTYQCVAAHFDSILQDARSGDELSAKVLYRSLSGCTSPAAVAGQLEKDVMIVDTATGQRSTVDHDEAMDRHIHGLQARCANFNAGQIAQLNTIGWLAAEAGNSQAQFNLASLVSHEADANKKAEQGAKLLDLLERNVQQKRHEALSVLSAIYNQGVLVKQDRVKALAYSLAYVSTLDESKKTASAASAQRVEAQMTAAERAQAENLSHRIVQN